MATAAELALVFKVQDQMTRDLKKIQSTMEKFARSAKTAGKATSSISLGRVAGAAGLGGMATLALKTGVAFNVVKENAQLAFATLLKDGGKATTMIASLDEAAKKTPFGFKELVPAAQRLLAFGFAADQVQPLLMSISDAVSAMGGSAEMVHRVSNALGQMQARGKVAAEEMLQLTEAGIPAWQILSENIDQVFGAEKAARIKEGQQRMVERLMRPKAEGGQGLSLGEAQQSAQDALMQRMMKLASSGQLKSSVVIKALQQGMAARFGGLSEKAGKTTSGAFSQFTEELERTFGTLSEGPFKTFAGILLGMTQALRDMSELFKTLPGPLQDVLGWITMLGVALGAGGVLAAVGSLIGGAGFGGLIGVFGTVARVIGTVLLGGLGALLSPLGLILVAVGALWLAWENNWFGIRDVTAAVLDWITDNVPRAWTTVVAWFEWLRDTAGGAIATAWATVNEWFAWGTAAAGGAVAGAWTTVVAWFEWLRDTAIATVAGAWARVVGWYEWLRDNSVPVIASTWTRVTELFESGRASVLDAVRRAFTGAVEWFVWVRDQAAEKIAAVKAAIMAPFEGLSQSISVALNDAFTNAVGWFAWLVGEANRLLGPVFSMIGEIRGLLGGGSVPGGGGGGLFPGGGGSAGGHFTPFAEGGIVTSPTLAMIGEAGAEAVIPLDRMNGRAVNVSVRVEGSMFGSDLDQIISAAIDRARRAGVSV